jgi:glycosyltransferase involved in cell wall biosynthesis
VTERPLDYSVVVPLYNEEESVDRLHQEIHEAATALALEYEIVYVDDGSSDGTFERLRAIRARDPRVRVVRFKRNYGQTPAMQAGLDHARGEVVITMDGDLQNDPRDFGKLLAAIDAGHDVVCGWRRDRKDKLVSRKIPSRVANWMIGKITGVAIHDNGCSLKAYRAEVVKKARLYAEMHRFIAPLMSLSGSKYTEIVVNHRARQFGKSKYGIARTYKVFLDMLAIKMILRFATRPAVYFAAVSLPFLGLSLASLAATIYLYATGARSEYTLVSSTVTVLLFVAFFHLVLLGMLAELVLRTGDYRETATLLAREASSR